MLQIVRDTSNPLLLALLVQRVLDVVHPTFTLPTNPSQTNIPVVTDCLSADVMPHHAMLPRSSAVLNALTVKMAETANAMIVGKIANCWHWMRGGGGSEALGNALDDEHEDGNGGERVSGHAHERARARSQVRQVVR